MFPEAASMGAPQPRLWSCGGGVPEPPARPVSPADSQLKVWMSKYGWSADESGQIFICSQEESIKPKNIVEKIDFDSEWGPKASGYASKELPFDGPGLGPQKTWVAVVWFRPGNLASAGAHWLLSQGFLLREVGQGAEESFPGTPGCSGLFAVCLWGWHLGPGVCKNRDTRKCPRVLESGS